MILIDSKVGIGDMDRMLCELLDSKKIPYIFVLTKCDKITEKKLEKGIEKIQEEPKDTFGIVNRTII